MRRIWLILAMLCGGDCMAGCIEAAGDQITAGELARALPEWGTRPAAEIVGHSPELGVRRVIGRAELDELARKHDVVLSAAVEVCVERHGVVRTAEEVEQALAAAAALGGLPAWTLVDFDTRPTLPGTLRFDKNDCRPHEGEPTATCMGYIIESASGRRSRFKARVAPSEPQTIVEAEVDLPLGAAISAEQIRATQVQIWPTERYVQAVDAAVGLTPRRTIRKGERLLLSNLVQPPIVQKGEAVEVRVAVGNSLLKMKGIARGSGRAGDYVLVENPESVRMFKGKVIDRDVLLVEVNQQKMGATK